MLSGKEREEGRADTIVYDLTITIESGPRKGGDRGTWPRERTRKQAAAELTPCAPPGTQDYIITVKDKPNDNSTHKKSLPQRDERRLSHVRG